MATYSFRNVCLFTVYKNAVIESLRKTRWKSEQRGLATIVKHQTTVDENTKEQLEQDVMTHGTHHGIVQPKNLIILPDRLQLGTRKYLKDQPVGQLKPHVQAMDNYLWSRKRPVEEADMRKRAKEYAEEMGVADIDEDSLDRGDLPKESKMKISKVMRKLKKELYCWKPIKYDEVKGVTYLLARLAPNYAAIYRVLHEIKQRVPDFSPQAVLDFGSGLGSTVWAAHQLWNSDVQQYYCVDTSTDMHSIAENILCGGNKEENEPYLNTVFFRHFLPIGSRVVYDLTVSAFALLELPSKEERLKTIETLWKKTDGFLVLIENGTFEGYMALMEARDFVLKEREAHEKNMDDGSELHVERSRIGQNTQVGHVFAPCQHDLTCPKLDQTKNIPCNFEQKYQPLSLSRKPPEPTTTRFSYLVLRKGERQLENAHWPRIVQPVMLRSKHVVCHLCCANGKLEMGTVTRSKHGFDLYRCARKSTWGDLLPISKPPNNESTLGQDDGNHWIQSEPNEERNNLHDENHGTHTEETLSNSAIGVNIETLTNRK